MSKHGHLSRNSSRNTENSNKKTNESTPFSANPLVLLVVGFILTGIVGQFLTYKYSKQQAEFQSQLEIKKSLLIKEREYEHDDRQKELEQLKQSHDISLARLRSFNDKLSEVRIKKISDVWEAVFKYDAALLSAISFISKSNVPTIINQPMTGEVSDFTTERFQEQIIKYKQYEKNLDDIIEKINPVKNEAMNKALQNRFWLSDDHYEKIYKYIIVSDNYFEALKDFSQAKINFSYAQRHLIGSRLLAAGHKSPESQSRIEEAKNTYLSTEQVVNNAQAEVNKYDRDRNRLRYNIIKARNEVFNK